MTDTSGCWRTGDFPDDDYWITVSVYDVLDNVRTDSMRVRLANGTAIRERGDPATQHGLSVPSLARLGAPLVLSLVLPSIQTVKLDVFDPAGRREQSSFDGILSSGRQEVTFSVSVPGVHLVVLTIGQDRIVHKMTVVR
jgi:hypothetical protein